MVPEAPSAAPWLLPHQRGAVARLAAILHRWHGALLADATGLGKTYIALALARAISGPTVAIVPAALRSQWAAVARRLGVSVTIWTHELLSRGRTPESRCHFVIVDEAHHFRNPTTRRYRALARWATGRRMLLVTATPIVNGTSDIAAILHLFLPDDAMRVVGVASLGALRRRTALRAVLEELAVARAHTDLPTLPALPRRVLRAPAHDGPLPDEQLLQVVGLIEELEAPGADEPRGLLRIQLYRRLCSSPDAFTATAQRHRRYLERAIDAEQQGLRLPRRAFRSLLGELGDPDQLAFLPLLLDSGDRWSDPGAMGRDLARLAGMITIATGRPDPKAVRLIELLGRAGAGGKALVFVNARATARYLARQIAGAVALCGQHGWTPAGAIPSDVALRPFGSDAVWVPPHLAARVLVATDVAGEGLDLQAASLVVHYDLPWTPARLAQRLGRIRRLGSPHRWVFERAFLPHPLLAERIRAVERLLAKARAGMAVNPNLDSPIGSITGRARGHPGARRAEDPAVVYRLSAGGYAATGGIPAGGGRGEVVRRLRALLRQAGRPVAVPPAVRTACRILLRTAARAARERDEALLAHCDRALARLCIGLTAGELLHLEDVLSRRRSRLQGLLDWVARMPPRAAEELRLDLAVVADLWE